jgi:hypothetical protein
MMGAFCFIALPDAMCTTFWPPWIWIFLICSLRVPSISGSSRSADRFQRADVLRAIGFEALVVAAAAVALLTGEPFTEMDRERLILAVSRIQGAMTAAGVTHHG